MTHQLHLRGFLRSTSHHWLTGTALFCVAGFLNAAAADEFRTAPAGTFSIAVIPDTQHYHGGKADDRTHGTGPTTNPVFESYAGWIADNLKQQRIAFVSHVGDIVDVNDREQWTIARQMMDKLHGRVPYGISRDFSRQS